MVQNPRRTGMEGAGGAAQGHTKQPGPTAGLGA